jgi:hypothetical protein
MSHLIPSLTDYALDRHGIFTLIWRLDAVVGWHITSGIRVERQGKSLILKIDCLFYLIILFPDL